MPPPPFVRQWTTCIVVENGIRCRGFTWSSREGSRGLCPLGAVSEASDGVQGKLLQKLHYYSGGAGSVDGPLARGTGSEEEEPDEDLRCLARSRDCGSDLFLLVV